MPNEEVVLLAPGKVLSEISGGTGVDASGATQGSVLKGTGSGLELTDPRMFASTANATVTNSVAETTLKAAGVGSAVLLANALAVGRMLRCTLSGIISTAAVPGTLTLRAKLNAVNLIASAAGTPTAAQASLFWRLTALFTCRAVGIATGSVIGQGAFENKAANTNVAALNAWDMSNTVPIAVDTTIAQTFDVTAQWETANVGNILICTNFLLELL